MLAGVSRGSRKSVQDGGRADWAIGVVDGWAVWVGDSRQRCVWIWETRAHSHSRAMLSFRAHAGWSLVPRLCDAHC
jgi:hypothetical protein